MRSRKEILELADFVSSEGIGAVPNVRPIVEVLLDIRDQNATIIELLQNQDRTVSVKQPESMKEII